MQATARYTAQGALWMGLSEASAPMVTADVKQGCPCKIVLTRHSVPGTLCATNSMITLDSKQNTMAMHDPAVIV